MPKDREKKFNPVAAAHKAEKNRQIKKNKAANLVQRTERLSKKNPWHLQKQLDELKEAKARGELDARHLGRIEGLEKEVKAIRKAREELGIKDEPPRERNVLGKRRRDGEHGERRRDDESETDEEAKGIPMPEDHENEPPLPRRRNKRPPKEERRGPHPLPEKPSAVESKTVYEAKPVLRDLHKEAAQKFIPRAVAERMRKAKGQAGLLEPEELDALEKAGYKSTKKVVAEGEKEALHNAASTEQPDKAMDEEMRRFEQEISVLDEIEPLEEQAKNDAQRAADEAEKEIIHGLMEEEVRGKVPELERPAKKKTAAPLAGLVSYSDSEEDEDDDEVNDVQLEAEQAADAAEKEAEFSMMADEEFDEFGNPVKKAERVEQHLRRVEIEEVEDEDL